jgi:hypothetical protein
LALALHANYDNSAKKLEKNKHSSLFCQTIGAEERSFITGNAVAQWLTVSNKRKIQEGLGFATQHGQIDLKKYFNIYTQDLYHKTFYSSN